MCVGTPSVGQASLVLGQPNFATTTNPYTTQSGFRNPTMVASDGKILVVADTDNNRVLIWNTIPTTIDQPADIVLGQTNFTTVQEPPPLNSSALRGPQGVWVQGTQLYRGRHAEQPRDDLEQHPDVQQSAGRFSFRRAEFHHGAARHHQRSSAHRQQLVFAGVGYLRRAAPFCDGPGPQPRVDLEFHSDAERASGGRGGGPAEHDQRTATTVYRLLRCNRHRRRRQPDLSRRLPDGHLPLHRHRQQRHAALSRALRRHHEFPRYALSDGQRLFIADGGNDRVLVYNSIPTTNGAKADIYLGQPDEFTDQVTTSTDTFRPDANILESAPNTIRTPYGAGMGRHKSLCLGSFRSPRAGVHTGFAQYSHHRNHERGEPEYLRRRHGEHHGNHHGGRHRYDHASHRPAPSSAAPATCHTGQECYTYTVVTNDTLASIVEALANLINGVKPVATPDPNVIATANIVAGSLFVVNLIARQPGLNGNNIGYAATTAAVYEHGHATEAATAAGSTLAGGAAAAELAPGTLVTIFGNNLADTTATATPDANGNYPTTNFNGVQVYFDGIRSPILSVSPTQINTQLPFEVAGSNGVSAFVRTVHNDGSVTATNAIGVPVMSAGESRHFRRRRKRSAARAGVPHQRKRHCAGGYRWIGYGGRRGHHHHWRQ